MWLFVIKVAVCFTSDCLLYKWLSVIQVVVYYKSRCLLYVTYSITYLLNGDSERLSSYLELLTDDLLGGLLSLVTDKSSPKTNR